MAGRSGSSLPSANLHGWSSYVAKRLCMNTPKGCHRGACVRKQTKWAETWHPYRHACFLPNARKRFLALGNNELTSMYTGIPKPPSGRRLDLLKHEMTFSIYSMPMKVNMYYNRVVSQLLMVLRWTANLNTMHCRSRHNVALLTSLQSWCRYVG